MDEGGLECYKESAVLPAFSAGHTSARSYPQFPPLNPQAQSPPNWFQEDDYLHVAASLAEVRPCSP
jgi:hypothetical protein